MNIEHINTRTLSRSTMEVRVVKVISPTLLWVHLKHCNARLDELLEDINEYMKRKKDRMLLNPDYITENEVVAVPTNRGWQRAIVIRFNENDTVQLMLRDWGAFKRHSKYNLYRLENHFREQSWFAIPCGLAYAGPTTRGLMWSKTTKALTKVLAENHEGWFNIIKPIKDEGALIRLSIVRKREEFARNLLQDLIDLGEVKKTSTPAVTVYPTVNL
ncbi:uncharacterized protein [Linepithema humile]|uniref:uncharacterized protein n=1 Tax=Linepithema humile TaxID=83485 RepID=UPI00351DC5C6